MDIHLTPVEARVLGPLIEKDITTPDYYPLSLNALVNACNQKNNREPVMNLDENAVRDALAGLQDQRLAGPARGADSRVTKYEHRLQELLNLPRGETALLCVLLLRGPQTPGELRGRSERMFRFEHLEDVEAALRRLIERDQPLVTMLQRQRGTKESRYAHLLSGEPQEQASIADAQPNTSAGDGDRLARIESEIAELRRELHELRQDFGEFKKQFG